MSRHFSPPVSRTPATLAILIDAARCWRDARDNNQPVQPSLSRMLAAYHCAMLAPVFDSLCLFYEAALGRPMTAGNALAYSDDETMLIGLMNQTSPRQRVAHPEGSTTLDCALWTTQIMLALTFRFPWRSIEPKKLPFRSSPIIAVRATR
jgi:hypothetical protein